MTHWAESYIGRPWVSGAAGPNAFDCYGLVRAVYLDQYGIALPVFDADALRPLSARRAMRDYPDYSSWDGVTVPIEGDVIQMGHASHPHHVGIYIAADGGRVLHSVSGAGVIAQSMTALAAHGWNILTIYRRRDARTVSHPA